MRRAEPGRGRTGTDERLRRGLVGLRAAAPSPDVWSRIEAGLAPPRADRRPRWRLSLPMATLSGALFLAWLSLGSLSASLALLRPGNVPIAEREVVVDHGLPPDELAIQPLVSPRPVALALPPGAEPLWPRLEVLSGWHGPQTAYNRADWPAAPPGPGPGSVPPANVLIQ